MVDDLDALLGRLGHGAVTLLYTNSVRDGANRLYPLFQAKTRRCWLRRSRRGRGQARFLSNGGPENVYAPSGTPCFVGHGGGHLLSAEREMRLPT